MASLAELLRGGPELGPLELAGGIAAQQAADPRLLTGGPGVAGSIANLSAATTAEPLAAEYARRIAAVQAASQNDMLKYLKEPDPIAAAAADPGGNPTARFAVSQMSPLQVAQMRQATATAELERAGIPSRLITGAAGGGLFKEIYPEAVGGTTPAAAASAPASAPAAKSAPAGAPRIADPFANLPRKDVLKRLGDLPPALQRQFLKRFQPAPIMTGAASGAG